MAAGPKDSVKKELEPHGRYGVSLELDNEYGEVYIFEDQGNEIPDLDELANSVAKKLGYQYGDGQKIDDGYRLRMQSCF